MSRRAARIRASVPRSSSENAHADGSADLSAALDASPIFGAARDQVRGIGTGQYARNRNKPNETNAERGGVPASVRNVAGARFPFLDGPRPIAFAHRGGALENVENTWTSFKHALDLGYGYMETDVHATSDEVAVAVHDPDLSRVSDSQGLVRDLTWHELSGIELTGGEQVPRLDDLLGAWPDVRWNIDAKHDSVVRPLADTLMRCDAVDRVCVTSFSDVRLERLKRMIGPRLCTAMGPAAVGTLRLTSLSPFAPGALSRAALLPFRRFGAVQVPTRYRNVEIIEPRFLNTAHDAGLQVHVWTIDDELEMARLLDLGVDGIMTDRPTLLKSVLEKRGEWRGRADDGIRRA